MRNVRALLYALMAGAALAGCGSTSEPQPASTTEAPTSETPTEAPSSEHGAYAHCLAEHGIDTPPAPAMGPQPGPAAPPPGVDPAAWEQATRACIDLAPGPTGS